MILSGNIKTETVTEKRRKDMFEEMSDRTIIQGHIVKRFQWRVSSLTAHTSGKNKQIEILTQDSQRMIVIELTEEAIGVSVFDSDKREPSSSGYDRTFSYDEWADELMGFLEECVEEHYLEDWESDPYLQPINETMEELEKGVKKSPSLFKRIWHQLFSH